MSTETAAHSATEGLLLQAVELGEILGGLVILAQVAEGDSPDKRAALHALLPLARHATERAECLAETAGDGSTLEAWRLKEHLDGFVTLVDIACGNRGYDGKARHSLVSIAQGAVSRVHAALNILDPAPSKAA